MLARVKQDYAAGPVMAFSGREYVRSEWREVPAGFEAQAQEHPLLDTQPSLKETRETSSLLPGLGKGEPEAAVTTETLAPETTSEAVLRKLEEPQAPAEPAEPPAEEPESKSPRRPRKRAAED